jgi:hypothetical protein
MVLLMQAATAMVLLMPAAAATVLLWTLGTLRVQGLAPGWALLPVELVVAPPPRPPLATSPLLRTRADTRPCQRPWLPS